MIASALFCCGRYIGKDGVSDWSTVRRVMTK